MTDPFEKSVMQSKGRGSACRRDDITARGTMACDTRPMQGVVEKTSQPASWDISMRIISNDLHLVAGVVSWAATERQVKSRPSHSNCVASSN